MEPRQNFFENIIFISRFMFLGMFSLILNGLIYVFIIRKICIELFIYHTLPYFGCCHYTNANEKERQIKEYQRQQEIERTRVIIPKMSSYHKKTIRSASSAGNAGMSHLIEPSVTMTFAITPRSPGSSITLAGFATGNMIYI